MALADRKRHPEGQRGPVVASRSLRRHEISRSVHGRIACAEYRVWCELDSDSHVEQVQDARQIGVVHEGLRAARDQAIFAAVE